MITKITLKNFKCFKEQTEFPLSQITLLTGMNGKGKSTLLQSLLLMRQSLENNNYTTEILLNGACLNLGNLLDIKNSDTSRDESLKLNYDYKYDIGSKKVTGNLSYDLIENEDDNMVLQIKNIAHSIKDSNSSEVSEKFLWTPKPSNEDTLNLLFGLIPIGSLRDGWENVPRREILSIFKDIHYISADRLGLQDFHLKKSLSDFYNVGSKGENAINLLSKRSQDSVNLELCLGEDVQNLITQTEQWLEYIFEGAKLEIPQSDKITIEPLFNNRYKASNVGFGYSYILPIIVSGLIAKNNQILIVENPEAHLHPKAQSRLIKFLAKVSKTGVQVLIESHSDHILNALRIAVLDKIVTSEQANILYFPQKIGQPIVQIVIQPDGKIEEWPEGFFDQMDIDFNRLFGI